MVETWEILRSVWFLLIGVLLAGYSILDGFDLGIGVLFPFLGKTAQEKEAVVRSIGPFWDGNEVWLLTGGGALFAAFPQAYATVFSGFYLALMVVLFALIFRAVSLEFRTHDPARRRLWEGAFNIGSFLPALLFGVALGNVIRGVPLDGQMRYAGNFLTLLNPFSLAVGLLGLAAFLLQGSSFAAARLSGDVRMRARRMAGLFWWAFIGLWAVTFVLGLAAVPGSATKIWAWVFTILTLASLAVVRAAQRGERDGLALILSSVAFASLWGIAGAVMYPNLIRAAGDPSLSLTIHNASSSRLTLTVMLVFASIGMPIVIGYTVYLYRVFRGRVRAGDEEYGSPPG